MICARAQMGKEAFAISQTELINLLYSTSARCLYLC